MDIEVEIKVEIKVEIEVEIEINKIADVWKNQPELFWFLKKHPEVSCPPELVWLLKNLFTARSRIFPSCLTVGGGMGLFLSGLAIV